MRKPWSGRLPVEVRQYIDTLSAADLQRDIIQRTLACLQGDWGGPLPRTLWFQEAAAVHYGRRRLREMKWKRAGRQTGETKSSCRSMLAVTQ